MGVLINKKRCDNADVCPCIESCPAKAFYYDKENETVAVHNELCINCRKCMITCEAGAVKVYRNEEEYAKLKTEYDEDIMTVEELFQDRYGATSIDEKFRLSVDELEKIISDSNIPLLIEFYNEDDASCLINSVAIKEIIDAFDIPLSYRKICIDDLEAIRKYGVDEIPAILVLDNKNVIYKHTGVVKEKEKETFLENIKRRNEQEDDKQEQD